MSKVKSPFQPIFGSVPVQVGINDYGLSIVNLETHATMMVLKHGELEPEPVVAKDKVDFTARKKNTVFTLSTNQVSFKTYGKIDLDKNIWEINLLC